MYKGKKVAIIGPAPTISISEDQEFDVLCFAGNYYRALPSLNKKGLQIDILYLGPRTTRWLFRTGYVEKKTIITEPSFQIEIPSYQSNVRFLNFDFEEKCKEIGCNLYTGMSAIVDVLSYDPESLYVTGFTFYHGEKIYIDRYAEGSDEELMMQCRGNLAGHNRGIQFDYFKKNIAHRIEMDNYLQGLILS